MRLVSSVLARNPILVLRQCLCQSSLSHLINEPISGRLPVDRPTRIPSRPYSAIVASKPLDRFKPTFSPKPEISRICRSRFPLNKFQTTRPMSSLEDELRLRNKYSPRERRFETPFGHTAALEWGNPENPIKILCVHGWLDNAGSFERLVPFILDHNDNTKKYHIIAMDHPGVGLSSHKPTGAEYTTFTTIIEMRRIVMNLKWSKHLIISHSLGSHLSYIYSCVYPDVVTGMISIDLAHPITRQARNWNVSIANSMEEHFKAEFNHDDDPTTNIRVPVYSESDALKRLMEGHSASLTKESAEVLFKRGAKKQRWGYTFTRDTRLRHLPLELKPDDELMVQFISESFWCSLMIIRAARSPYHRPESVRLRYYEIFAKNCPIFKDIIMDGTHHLHLNSPSEVASEMNKFLDQMEQQSKTAQNKSKL